MGLLVFDPDAAPKAPKIRTTGVLVWSTLAIMIDIGVQNLQVYNRDVPWLHLTPEIMSRWSTTFPKPALFPHNQPDLAQRSQSKTCLLCDTADMSAVSNSRHFCCVTRQTYLLYKDGL